MSNNLYTHELQRQQQEALFKFSMYGDKDYLVEALKLLDKRTEALEERAESLLDSYAQLLERLESLEERHTSS